MEVKKSDIIFIAEKIIDFLKSTNHGLSMKKDLKNLSLGSLPNVYSALKLLEDSQLVMLEDDDLIRLTQEGFMFKNFEEFNSKKERDSEKLNMEIEKLKRNLADYDFYKRNAVFAKWVSIGGLIIAIVSIIISILQ